MTIVTLPLPAQISNGTTADATQVMNNFNTMAANINLNVPLATVAQATLANTSVTQSPLDNSINIATTAYTDSTAPVVGSIRNGRMYISAAGTSGTFTADEIALKTALGGAIVIVSSFSQVINVSTTGAGGMDTGTAPTSGFVAIYAIYNPTTLSASIVATNAATLAPNVYAGGHMPAGYTASALISVWPTNGSGQFVLAYQNDRQISLFPISALSTTTNNVGYISLSLASVVPINAKTVDLELSLTNASVANCVMGVSGGAAATAIGNQEFEVSQMSVGGPFVANARQVPLITAQTINYFDRVSAGTLTFTMSAIGYTI